ncbi:MAG: hypothetical protein ACK6BZ_00430 [Candidatus Kapaibacterium sp.]
MPESIRSYIPKANNVYTSFADKNYANILTELNISDSVPSLKIAESIAKNDIASILKYSNASFTTITNTAQNVFNFDTLNTVRNVVRSGSAAMNIIDEGSITKVESLQNLLVSASSDATYLPIAPGVTDVFKTALNETRDVNTNVDLFKASAQTMLGFPVGVDAFDSLTLQGLKEKAYKNAQTNNVRTFSLPQSLPDWKKETWAIEITKDTGVATLSGLQTAFN